MRQKSSRREFAKYLGLASLGLWQGLDASGAPTHAAPNTPALPQGTPAEIEKTEMLLRSARELREKFLRDPHRPEYHFLPPAGWMNDINGPIFWKSKYHIFYQCNPDEARWKQTIQWGHASSTDLVHWVHHPVALAPTPDGPDRAGCFSGCLVVNNGVPTIIYHGVPDGTCLATSQDDELIQWTKNSKNPVIRVPKPGDAEYGKYWVFDPSAWKHGEHWYVLCGRTDPAGGDTGYLFRSPDLINWQYLHPFYQSDRRWTEADEDCAVPNFFPLGNKYMLLFGSHKHGTQYYLGRYAGDKFYPESHGRMSWPGGQQNGAITMLDGTGRRLFFNWVYEERTEAAQRAAGWAGVMVLPRILSLASDGTLQIEPVPELQALRLNQRQRQDLYVNAQSEIILNEIRGDCLEIAVEAKLADAEGFGLMVRCSPDGSERTSIVYSPHAKTLRVDLSRSSLDPVVRYPNFSTGGIPQAGGSVQAQEAPFTLAVNESLKLRVYLDRSVLEVFANGRQCITQRIYPSRGDSLGVGLCSGAGAVLVSSIAAWDMTPSGS
jgi:sucrose-6-phosphate hydrolase SacC (GH32 family)